MARRPALRVVDGDRCRLHLPLPRRADAGDRLRLRVSAQQPRYRVVGAEARQIAGRWLQTGAVAIDVQDAPDIVRRRALDHHGLDPEPRQPVAQRAADVRLLAAARERALSAKRRAA